MDTCASQLRRVWEDLDRSPAICESSSIDGSGSKLVDWSPFTGGAPPSVKCVKSTWSVKSNKSAKSRRSNSKGTVDEGPDSPWGLVRRAAEEQSGCGSAIGSLLGLALGDSVGAPLEFCNVDERLPDGAGGRYCDRERPCVLSELREGQLCYNSEYNKFGVGYGQWTDDTSMALCLADSLLVNGKYHGGDARVRWHMWWNHGYCNAFRHDLERPRGRGSVGLGGNVAKSLQEVERYAISRKGKPHDDVEQAELVPPIYQSSTNDAGNGSIMRLAPVPIAFHLSAWQAVEVASWQSLASHPGDDAAACCRFMAFFIQRAIGVHRDEGQVGDVQQFMTDAITVFLEHPLMLGPMALGDGENQGLSDGNSSAGARLRALLLATPESAKESHWAWKEKELRLSKAILARGGHHGLDKYNGHPVIPTYFGAYCMDGLAMALWAIWNSNSFSQCLQRAVNLLGDADTVGAITGQLAGAVHGWRGIVSDPWSRACLNNLKRWDPGAEVGLRAALLYHHGPRPEAQVRQAEGYDHVRVFDTPKPGSKVIGEIPSEEWVLCVDVNGAFMHVEWPIPVAGDAASVAGGQAPTPARQPESVAGWIGVKNVAVWAPAPGTEDLTSWQAGARYSQVPSPLTSPRTSPRRELGGDGDLAEHTDAFPMPPSRRSIAPGGASGTRRRRIASVPPLPPFKEHPPQPVQQKSWCW